MAPITTAPRRQVFGMNIPYVKMSSSQKGNGGGMPMRPPTSNVTRYCNIMKNAAGEPKITSSAIRSCLRDTSRFRHKVAVTKVSTITTST